MSQAEQAGMPDVDVTVMGARWGAISGRHGATGNLLHRSMTFPNPVFHGDTLRAESTILRKRESKSRSDAGIVWFEHRGYNQHDDLVHLCHRAGMIMKKPADAAD